MSKEHPILFSGDMVRAILDGRKTQTRRIIKPQPPKPPEPTGRTVFLRAEVLPNGWNERDTCAVVRFWYDWNNTGRHEDDIVYGCPYGRVGDRLYLQEGYKIDSCEQGYFIGTYQADGSGFKCLASDREIDIWDDRRFPFRKTSGRFMYKSLARIWLEITAIRVERIAEISPEDCIAEGIELIYGKRDLSPSSGYKDYSKTVEACGATASFHTLWDSINAKRDYGWEVNPWVFVIELRRYK